MADNPYAPFRPRRGRGVALGAAVASVLVFGTVAFTLSPAAAGTGTAGLVNRVLVVGIGLGIAWLLRRYAGLVAIPDPEGLLVRNLLQTQRVAWPDVVRVQLSGGMPWVVLDLADAEQLPVMAIQKADGRHAQQEAARMAALVEFHSQTTDAR